jgi:hypothetical protein
VLELWSSSVDEKDVLLDVFAEALSAFFVDENVGLAATFLNIIFFFHKWAELFEKIFRRDSLLVVLFLDKSDLLSG